MKGAVPLNPELGGTVNRFEWPGKSVVDRVDKFLEFVASLT